MHASKPIVFIVNDTQFGYMIFLSSSLFLLFYFILFHFSILSAIFIWMQTIH